MSRDKKHRNMRRLTIALACVLVIALLAVVFTDMTIGAQHLSFVLGGKPNEEQVNRIYYPDGGFRIGKWQIVRPPLKVQYLGYVVEVLPDGTRVPIGVGTGWYPDGTLKREHLVFDESGQETQFYLMSTSDEELAKLQPHAKVVMRDYKSDGSLELEQVWINGVLQK